MSFCNCKRFLAAALCIAWAGQLRAAEPVAASLSALLQQLASPDFAQRDAAQKQLAQLPADQHDALNKLAAEQTDEEVKARLRARAAEMLRELVGQRMDAPLRAGAHLTGRVVDNAGKPIADADIRATSRVWGRDIFYAGEQHARSNAEGLYDLSVPYAEIAYEVSVEARGHNYLEGRTVIAQRATALDNFVLAPAPNASVKGTLVDAGGKPVANQMVEIIATGTRRGAAVTDAQGQFEVGNLGPYLTQPIARVRTGHQTVAVEIIRQNVAQLQLVPAATVSGKIVTDRGQAVAGATVYLHPYFTNGMRETATTAADGSYAFADVPPGEFTITADAPAMTRAAPHQVESQLPRVKLAAGETRTLDITLEPMAILRGQVLSAAGKPVPDALVCIQSSWRGDFHEKYRCVQTDADGRYLIATGFTAEPGRRIDDTLTAFSAAEGYIAVSVKDLVPNETRELTITLPGSTRITGTITDAGGKAVPGVACRTNLGFFHEFLSDAGGHFDLGRMSLLPDGPLLLTLRAPRPSTAPGTRITATSGEIHPDFARRADAPTYYAHQELALQPGRAENLKFTLQPAELLEFRGTVLDSGGKPAANAEVYLMTGDAGETTWVESARPTPLTSSRAPNIRDKVLSSGKTDAQGRFLLWGVRETGTSALVDPARDYKQFTLGVYAGGKAKLTGKLDVPASLTAEVKVQLDP